MKSYPRVIDRILDAVRAIVRQVLECGSPLPLFPILSAEPAVLTDAFRPGILLNEKLP